jgi:hypothetical protein
MLFKDMLSKDMLSKDMLYKDMLSKDMLSKDMLLSKDIKYLQWSLKYFNRLSRTPTSLIDDFTTERAVDEMSLDEMSLYL